MGGDNLPPPVGIGLTELPNSGGAKAPPASPLTTALVLGVLYQTFKSSEFESFFFHLSKHTYYFVNRIFLQNLKRKR